MFHSNTDRFIQTWRDRQDGFTIPHRSDLSPMDLGGLLPQVFMLGTEKDDEVFRLCGGLVADLYRRDLRGTFFRSLWVSSDFQRVSDAHELTIKRRTPAVLTADAIAANGESVGVEICLAPLRGPSGRPDRTIGLLQPIAMVGRLMGQPVCTLLLRNVQMAGAVTRPSPVRLVAVNGQRLA